MAVAKSQSSSQCQLVDVVSDATTGFSGDNHDAVVTIHLDNDALNVITKLKTVFGCINLEFHMERLQDVVHALEIISLLGQEQTTIFGNTFVIGNFIEEMNKLNMPHLARLQDLPGIFFKSLDIDFTRTVILFSFQIDHNYFGGSRYKTTGHNE